MPQTARACPKCRTPLPTFASFCYVCGTATPPAIDRDTGEYVTAPPSGITPEEARARLQRLLGPAYELGERIGSGGFAEVFRARDLRLKRDLAVKMLRPDVGLAPSMLQRFRREAEAIAGLRHPHIVQIYDVGEGEGIAYIVMPYVSGETLRARLERDGRFPVALARRVLLEAASALEAAHDMGMVHRDVKPENIMLEGRAERVLLMDFGIAKAIDAATEGTSAALTSTGLIVGTPHYMSPEQAIGDRGIDHRTDQYSLAVVGYRMLSGVLPFEGTTIRAILTKQLVGQATPLHEVAPDVPPALAEAVETAMSKDPNDRFESMGDFAAVIRSDPAYVEEMTSASARPSRATPRLSLTPPTGVPPFRDEPAPSTPAVPAPADPPATAEQVEATASTTAAGASPPAPADATPTVPPHTPTHAGPRMTGATLAGAPRRPAKPRASARDRLLFVGSALAVLVAGGGVLLWRMRASESSAGGQRAATVAPPVAPPVARPPGDTLRATPPAAAGQGTPTAPAAGASTSVAARPESVATATPGGAPDSVAARLRADSALLRRARLRAGTPAADSFLAGMALARRRPCEARFQARAFAEAQSACAAEARLGRAPAQRIMGQLAERAQRWPQAAAWYDSASARDLEARVLLARMLDDGRGAAVDHKRALTLLQEAAIGGHVGAQMVLGERYTRGADGTPRDDKIAAMWYGKAAEAGHVPAMMTVAELFRAGRGVPRNDADAAAWWARAAAAGDPAAQYQLGMAYLRGKGVARSDSTGLAWLRKAAAQGHSEAAAELKRRGG